MQPWQGCLALTFIRGQSPGGYFIHVNRLERQNNVTLTPSFWKGNLFLKKNDISLASFLVRVPCFGAPNLHRLFLVSHTGNVGIGMLSLWSQLTTVIVVTPLPVSWPYGTRISSHFQRVSIHSESFSSVCGCWPSWPLWSRTLRVAAVYFHYTLRHFSKLVHQALAIHLVKNTTCIVIPAMIQK